MNKKDLRIVYMGTPDFAVASLDILVEHGYNVVGVITSTDKWGGRGNKTLLESAVKKYAVKKGLKVLQPSNLKAIDFKLTMEQMNQLDAICTIDTNNPNDFLKLERIQEILYGNQKHRISF